MTEEQSLELLKYTYRINNETRHRVIYNYSYIFNAADIFGYYSHELDMDDFSFCYHGRHKGAYTKQKTELIKLLGYTL